MRAAGAQRQISLLVDGSPCGPYSVSEVRSRLTEGTVDNDTPYRLNPADEWRPLRELELPKKSGSRSREQVVWWRRVALAALVLLAGSLFYNAAYFFRPDPEEVLAAAGTTPLPQLNLAELRGLALTGHIAAQFELAGRLMTGKGVRPNVVEARQTMEDAANSLEELNRNAVETYARLGQAGAGVEGTVQQTAASVAWLKRAAAMGHPASQERLAAIYATGRGLPRNTIEATRLYLAAAASGSPTAAHEAAMRLLAGEGADQDVPAALGWLEKAAVAGHAPAQEQLAVLLLEGQGTTADPRRAVSLLRQAAEEGRASAQIRLGAIYLDGEHVRRDPVEGVRLLRRAIDSGSVEAMTVLGLAYQTGRGVAREPAEAIALLETAAERGSREARAALDNLQKGGISTAGPAPGATPSPGTPLPAKPVVPEGQFPLLPAPPAP